MDIPEFRAQIEELVTGRPEINDADFWDLVSDWFIEVLVERSKARRAPSPSKSFSPAQLYEAARGYVSTGTDPHRGNPNVHYRLYQDRRGQAVVCIQDFDYVDYDPTGFLSPGAWDSEAEACHALSAFRSGLATDCGWPELDPFDD